jgi:hypothetical protein
MIAEYEIQERPLTDFELQHARVMQEHYARRIEESPGLKLARQALRYYTQRLKSSTVNTIINWQHFG